MEQESHGVGSHGVHVHVHVHMDMNMDKGLMEVPWQHSLRCMAWRACWT